jgi:hypothetical protein
MDELWAKGRQFSGILEIPHGPVAAIPVNGRIWTETEHWHDSEPITLFRGIMTAPAPSWSILVPIGYVYKMTLSPCEGVSIPVNIMGTSKTLDGGCECVFTSPDPRLEVLVIPADDPPAPSWRSLPSML